MMRKTWLMVVILGLGCAGTGEPETTVDEYIESAAPKSAETSRPAAEPTRRVSPELLPDGDERWTSTHHNLTIQVDDPSTALIEARAMFLKAGAMVQNSNRQGLDNASINVTMSPEQYASIASKLQALPGKVTYENSSSNSMGPQTRQLRERLALAHKADALLTAQTKHAQGEDLDALMLMHELNMRERTNLESQIRSYWDQAGKTFVYLTFQRPQ